MLPQLLQTLVFSFRTKFLCKSNVSKLPSQHFAAKNMQTDDHIPRDLRQLRACLVCSAVKSVVMFEEQGCDNCEHLLELKGDSEKVDLCTRFAAFWRAF